MDLQNRWFVFVTNLYSSAIFIGWGCVLVCLFVEYFYRNGMAIERAIRNMLSCTPYNFQYVLLWKSSNT